MDSKTKMALLFLNFCLALANASPGVMPNARKRSFYSSSCPAAESTVNRVVRAAVRAQPRRGAALIRMLFHDCFALGCDASLLLDGPNSEKTAPPNLSLHSFEVLDEAKAAVESICPGTVSCADIVVMAARDSYAALGGSSGYRFGVDLGRRDATVGLASNTGDIPLSTFDAEALIAAFADKGLSAEQMVALSGAHTVGMSQCSEFTQRLYPTVDPTLDPDFAERLRQLCPLGGDPSLLVTLDSVTPTKFDNQYFNNLQVNRSLLISDQTLFTSASTRDYVDRFGAEDGLFFQGFVNAFRAMSRINILTGSDGEIRTNCRVVNS